MKLLKYEPSDLRRAWTTKGAPSALEEDLQECDETVNQDPERQRPPGFTAAPPALVFFVTPPFARDYMRRGHFIHTYSENYAFLLQQETNDSVKTLQKLGSCHADVSLARLSFFHVFTNHK